MTIIEGQELPIALTRFDIVRLIQIQRPGESTGLRGKIVNRRMPHAHKKHFKLLLDPPSQSLTTRNLRFRDERHEIRPFLEVGQYRPNLGGRTLNQYTPKVFIDARFSVYMWSKVCYLDLSRF